MAYSTSYTPLPDNPKRDRTNHPNTQQVRQCPHRKLRRKVPRVDGALTTQPRTPTVPPARSASASSMHGLHYRHITTQTPNRDQACFVRSNHRGRGEKILCAPQIQHLADWRGTSDATIAFSTLSQIGRPWPGGQFGYSQKDRDRLITRKETEQIIQIHNTKH